MCIFRGADGRNKDFTVWCMLDEHACAVGALCLNLASVTVNKMWTTTHIRPKPCFQFLQSSMGLAVRADIARLDYSEDLDGESKVSTGELAFVRLFSKMKNIYCCNKSDGSKRRTDRAEPWCFVSMSNLCPFSMPEDYFKVSMS
jgi:hypothetical protein